MNIISICNRCKAISSDSIISRLKKFDSTLIFQIGCNTTCGIGREKQVVLLNHRMIVASTEDELISNIIDKLREVS